MTTPRPHEIDLEFTSDGGLIDTVSFRVGCRKCKKVQQRTTRAEYASKLNWGSINATKSGAIEIDECCLCRLARRGSSPTNQKQDQE